jgi:hypothetical protein
LAASLALALFALVGIIGAWLRPVWAATPPPATSIGPADAPQAVVTGFTPTALAANLGFIFVARQGHGLESCQLDPAQTTVVLQRMTFDGGNKIDLLSRCNFMHHGIVADQTHVYIHDSDNKIKRMPAAGGALQILVNDAGSNGGIAIDDTHLFWGRRDANSNNNQIWRIAKDGVGGAQLVANIANGDNIYFIRSLAVDDTHVFWTEGKQGNEVIDQPGQGAIKRSPKGGGAILTLADSGDGIQNPKGIALDDDHVYWTEADTARARRVSKNGGAVLSYNPAADNFMAGSIAVDDDHVFWTDTDAGYAGKLRRADVGGGGLTDIAIGLLGPGNLLLTNNHVHWTQSGGVYRLPLGAEETAVDFSIEAIEVTQAIQNLNNSVPLVAEKRAYVRVYPRVDVLTGQIPKIRLRGYKNGVELDWSPLPPLDAAVAPRVGGANRFRLDNTFNFWLPEHWRVGGDLTLRAEINYDGAISETKTDNNTRTVVVNLRKKKPLCVEMVSVRTSPQTAKSSDPGFMDILDWLNQSYPIPYALIDIGGTIEEAGGPYELGADTNKVLARMGWYRLWHDHNQWQKCGAAHFFGMVHPSEISAGGIGYRPGWAAWGVMATDSFTQAVADVAPWYAPHGGAILSHEIGHNKGRKHVDCGDPDGTDDDYPYVPCNIADGFPGGDVGLDYLDEVVIGPADAGDLMSYAMSIGKPRWPSAYTYKAIEDKIPDANLLAASTADLLAQADFATPGGRDLAPALLAADSVLLVSALVTPTAQTAAFDLLYSVPAGTIPADKLIDTAAATLVTSDGPYTLRLLDANQNTLGLLSFALPDADGPPWIDTGGGSSFVLVMPYPAGTAHTALEQGITEVARRTASAHAPVVRVLEPNGGEAYAGSLTIRWQASDLDNDPLSYVVQYSPDEGESWRLVESDTTATTLPIDDTRHLPGTDGLTALVRVFASDGLLTGSDISNRPFSLRPNPPQAGIANPSQGEIVGWGQALNLAGSAFDAEDGRLAGDKLRWSIDGVPSGAGEDLLIGGTTSFGKHTARLVATDSDNMTAAAQHTFFVQKRYCEDNQNQLDLVFIIDNGAAMSDHAEAFCKKLPDILTGFSNLGVKLRHQVFDITPARSGGPQSACATAVVQTNWPAGIDHGSDWGQAVAAVSANYAWRDGYTRVVVPITNGGPENGNPTADPGPDRDAVQGAIAAAVDAAAAVSPLMMPPADSINFFANMILAGDLAAATGGEVMQWADPTLDLAVAVQDVQAQHGCSPEVDETRPGVVSGGHEEICLTGEHLRPGTRVVVGGREATDVNTSPSAGLLCFRLPPSLPPGQHSVQLDRPGARPNPNAGAVQLDPGRLPMRVWLPLLERGRP